jgi:uncharacterized protein (DUF362 family)
MPQPKGISRRELMAGAAQLALGGFTLPGLAFGLGRSGSCPTAPVAIARCRSYKEDLAGIFGKMFDQIGGIGSLVKGKTVAIKLNLTGQPTHFPVKPELPYRTNPDTVLAVAHLLARAGAQRIRILETFFPAGQDMALWARYGLDIAAINNVGCKVEWENGQNLGNAKKYVELKVPYGGYIFPAYHLNHSFADCDVFVSMSKMKNHWFGGVTMSIKNSFGNTPCALYGDDCGASGNEAPSKERGAVCHSGKIGPPKGVPQELDTKTPRDAGYRVTRIAVDLIAARPVHLAIVDGVDSIAGAEGEWNRGVKIIHPGVLLAGKNPVCVDAAGMAVMSYDPKADRGTKPFYHGDNALKLAEAVGIGTTDLSRIELAGLPLEDARIDFGPGPVG